MTAQSTAGLLSQLTGQTGNSAEEVYARWAGILVTDGQGLEVLVRRKLTADGKAAQLRESLLGTLRAGGAGGEASLSASLVAGTPYAALPVASLLSAVVEGDELVFTGQSAIASSGALVGATAIPVVSFTPTQTLHSGSRLTWGAQSVQQALLRTGLTGWS